jgi:hypothetical protein
MQPGDVGLGQRPAGLRGRAETSIPPLVPIRRGIRRQVDVQPGQRGTPRDVLVHAVDGRLVQVEQEVRRW